jgi:Ca-activated chloride channel family protein
MIRARAAGCLSCLSVVTLACGILVVAPATGSAATARSLRTYVTQGTTVHGTPSPAGAPSLKPGQYKDTLRADEPKNYTVSLADGVSPYFAVTVIRPPGVIKAGQAGDYLSVIDQVRISLGTAAGADCGYVEDSTNQGRLVSPATAAARPGRVGGGWTERFSGSSDSGCSKPGKYVVSVSRTQGSDAPNVSLPIEMVFVNEPPLAQDVTDLPQPQPASGSAVVPDITAAARAVSGGGSYGTAAALGGSGSYTDTIRPGETLFYRVRLDWGQRLGYTVRVRGQKSIDAIYSYEGRLATPFREDIYGSDGSGTYSRFSDDKITGQTAAAVSYRNRESDTQTVWQLRLAGYYYLIVTMANGTAPTSAEIPLDVAVLVTGKPSPAPKYRRDVPGTSDPESLSVPGQESPGGSLLRKVAYLSGGGLALVLAALVLFLPVVRRRAPGP